MLNEKELLAWVKKNCKFAEMDYPAGVSDADFDTGHDLPSGPGPEARNISKFNALFHQFVTQEQLQPYLTEFETKKGLQPGSPLSVPDAFEFMSEGDMPDWASDFCPGHNYDGDSRRGGYTCSVCHNHLDDDFDEPAPRERDDNNTAGGEDFF